LPVRVRYSDIQPDRQECLSYWTNTSLSRETPPRLSPGVLHFRNPGRIPRHFNVRLKLTLSEKD